MPYALSFKPLAKSLGAPVMPVERCKRITQDGELWRATFPIYGKYRQCLITFTFHHTFFGWYYLDSIIADTLDGRIVEIPLNHVHSRWFDYRGLVHTLLHNYDRYKTLRYEEHKNLTKRSYILNSGRRISEDTGYITTAQFTGVPEHDLRLKMENGQAKYVERVAHEYLKNPHISYKEIKKKLESN